MQTSQAASQLSQSAALVGKQIAVDGSTLVPNSSGAATGAFTLGAAAQSAAVTVLAPDGTVAGTEQLGSLPAGQQTFSWSGGTPGTSYTYQVSASSSSGSAVSVTPYTVYTVTGVNASGGSQSFDVQGSAAPIAASSVQSVLGATTS
jgi:flagellar basal-body rod modification protein FlgD